MLDMGILDPTKVTRLALQNASSVAGLLLTTEVMVAAGGRCAGRDFCSKGCFKASELWPRSASG